MISAASRPALVHAVLPKCKLTGILQRARGRAIRARKAVHFVMQRFGYLQIDTVSIAGARSRAMALLSRIEGFDRGIEKGLQFSDGRCLV